MEAPDTASAVDGEEGRRLKGSWYAVGKRAVLVPYLSVRNLLLHLLLLFCLDLVVRWYVVIVSVIFDCLQNVLSESWIRSDPGSVRTWGPTD
jgi:hypothetical protein